MKIAEVAAAECAVIDASSARALAPETTGGLLHTVVRERYGQRPMTPDAKLALDTLSRVVVYGALAADARALESLDLGSDVPAGLVRRIEISDGEYEELRTVVEEDARALRTFLPRAGEDDYEESGERPYHDDIESFSASNESLERALFYLALGRRTGTPVIMSSRKRVLVEEVGHRVEDYLDQVVSTIDDAVRKEFEATVGTKLTQTTFSAPPLVDLLWKTALEHQLSPLHAALKLSDSEEAKGFRKWFRAVDQALREGRTGALEAGRQMEFLIDAAKTWGRALNANVGVTHDLIEIKMHAVPWTAWLFEYIGGGKASVKIPNIKPVPRHVAFVANWYREKR